MRRCTDCAVSRRLDPFAGHSCHLSNSAPDDRRKFLPMSLGCLANELATRIDVAPCSSLAPQAWSNSYLPPFRPSTRCRNDGSCGQTTDTLSWPYQLERTRRYLHHRLNG